MINDFVKYNNTGGRTIFVITNLNGVLGNKTLSNFVSRNIF